MCKDMDMMLLASRHQVYFLVPSRWELFHPLSTTRWRIYMRNHYITFHINERCPKRILKEFTKRTRWRCLTHRVLIIPLDVMHLESWTLMHLESWTLTNISSFRIRIVPNNDRWRRFPEWLVRNGDSLEITSALPQRMPSGGTRSLSAMSMYTKYHSLLNVRSIIHMQFCQTGQSHMAFKCTETRPHFFPTQTHKILCPASTTNNRAHKLLNSVVASHQSRTRTFTHDKYSAISHHASACSFHNDPPIHCHHRYDR